MTMMSGVDHNFLLMTALLPPHFPQVLATVASELVATALPRQLHDGQAMAAWLESCSTLSPHTLRSYEKETTRFRMWLEFVKGDHPRLLASATTADANRYLEYLAAPSPLPYAILDRYMRAEQPFAGPLKASSIKQAVMVLHAMYLCFQEIEDEGGKPYVAFNPFSLVRKNVRNQPRLEVAVLPDLEPTKILTLDIWAQVERFLDDQVKANPEDAAAHRDRWVVKLLYHSWLRRHEAAGIKMGSFSYATGKWRLHLVGKGQKKASIVATAELMRALREYRVANGLPPSPLPGEDRPAVLALRKRANDAALVTDQTIYRIVVSTFEKMAKTMEDESPAAAQQLRAVGPHWMRHTGITHVSSTDVDPKVVSKQARHANIQTTMNVYFHPEDADMREPLEQARAMVNSKLM